MSLESNPKTGDAGRIGIAQNMLLKAMDLLSLYGLVAVGSMVAFYALEDRHHYFTLAFAGGCVLASVYGFLAGAWPFGVVEAIWAVIAAVRWRRRAAG